MADTVFLTGATGYIGASLLRKWLESSEARIALLARGKREQGPGARIGRAIAEVSSPEEAARFAERIEIVEGDLSSDRFGLAEERYRDLASRTTHIIHCAAAARFDLDLEDARKTNVDGTKRILDFGKACRALERIDYIGTAYVAGRRKGIVREDELDEGQEHSNTYERSKLEAEKLVRESMRELPIAILRPSIVICDSRTGRATTHNGFYRAMRMYFLGLMKVVPGDRSGAMDLVPVDYVTDAVHAIASNPATIGGCFHLTAGLNNATPLEEIAELASRHFKREKFAIVPPEMFMAQISGIIGGLGEKERDMIKEILLYMPYLSGELRFDSTNAVRATGLEAPPVRSYFEKMAEYIIAREQQRNTTA